MRNFLFCLVFLFVPMIVHAQAVPAGSTVYIVPMESGLEQFLAAEIFKQKIPLAVSALESNAQYVLVGKSIDKGNNVKWYDVVWGTAGRRDSLQASVTLVRKSDKSIVWAANAGDRQAMFGLLKRGGERKVALRIVKSMKKDLF